MSTLTAILCNYNHARFLDRAIEAMLTQSRPPDQLIIVDDGSTDDSASVIRRWAERSPSILFLENGQNRGFHASSARALAAAIGDYVYSGAADDYVLPGFFERVCGLLDAHPGVGVGCAMMVKQGPDGGRIRCDGFRKITAPICLSPGEFRRLCLDAEPATHSLSSATIYRHAALKQVGGWRQELGAWADTFAIRAIGLTTGLCYVPVEGTVWVVHTTGLSQSTLHHPAAAARMIASAARLMRSPEFQSVFPEDHVRQWERDYFQAVVAQQLHSRYAAIMQGLDPGNRLQRVLRWPRYFATILALAWTLGPVRSGWAMVRIGSSALARRAARWWSRERNAGDQPDPVDESSP